jgi:diguanylate cyclase (GGDEF)-like protein/PAS domain S-box-containing protein
MLGAVKEITKCKLTQTLQLEAQAKRVAADCARSLLEASLDPLVTINPEGMITDANSATEMITGCSRDKLIGSCFINYFTEPLKALEGYRKVFNEGKVRNYALEIRHRNGHLTPVLYNASVYKNEAGQVVGIFAEARDITEIKRIETELRISEAHFKTVFNEAPLGIALIDSLTGQVYSVNPMFAKITGRTIDEMMTIDWMSITHPDDVQADLDNMALLNAEEISGFQVEKRYLKHDGIPVWINMTIAPIYVEDKTHPRHLCMIEDITKRKAIEQKINQLAYYDQLTELPNRRMLRERLKHSIDMERRDGKQLALLMLDLDRFKIVNDSLGHLAGDELLQQIAVRLRARLRDVDMVARLGGDEFIVLLEDIAQPEDAARVAKEIISDLSKPFCLNQRDNIQIGVSIGISLYPEHGDNPDILIDHADTALYKVKDTGRGCFAYFSEDLTVAALARMTLETRLRHAVEQQQLRVFYQPQVDIASGRIVGAEALVRWKDPVQGLVPPSCFIPLAEATGLIVDIGGWALRETCRQGREWLDEGLPPLTLAVNISPYQFLRGDISALVATVLGDTRFPAEQLELEITEQGLMGNQDNITDTLTKLRAQGVNIAIDDFGSGYSSLSCLKKFPVNQLKIDRSFIEGACFHQEDLKIAATIIAMGHILNLKVLADGVETQELLAFLQEKGCDIYQGYIKSKPLSAQYFAQLLRNQQ